MVAAAEMEVVTLAVLQLVAAVMAAALEWVRLQLQIAAAEAAAQGQIQMVVLAVLVL